MGEARDLIGQVLHDTYRIERLLGEGGMGAVYEASHLRLARRFAVKMLFPAIAAHPEAMARFKREAEVTSALGHPHIVEVIDFYQLPDGNPYLVMELLEGEDLGVRLERAERLELSEVASILRQATAGLQAAHQHGVIHRDLKPQNIFLCRRGERDNFVKVVDFGISKVLSSQSAMTRPEVLMGSPSYMAPEQAEQRASEVDARTDVYAMGVILYEMLAGQLPFSADSVPALLYAIVHTDPPPLRSLWPDVPEAVENVIQKAMRKRPEGRYSSMGGLWREFSSAMELRGDEFREPTEDREWTRARAFEWREDVLPPGPGAASIGDFPTAVRPSDREAWRDLRLPHVTHHAPARLDAAPHTIQAPLLLIRRKGEEARITKAPPGPASAKTTLSLGVGEASGLAALRAQLGGRRIATIAVLLLVAGVFGSILGLYSRNGSKERPQSNSVGRVRLRDTSSSDKGTSGVIGTISIALQNLPHGARVTVDGQLVKGNPLRIPRSDRAQTLDVLSPNGAQFSVRLVPNRDLLVDVRLRTRDEHTAGSSQAGKSVPPTKMVKHKLGSKKKPTPGEPKGNKKSATQPAQESATTDKPPPVPAKPVPEKKKETIGEGTMDL